MMCHSLRHRVWRRYMALQIALAVDVPPHESAENFKVVGYDYVWHDTTFDDKSSEHAKYEMWQSGMFVGPDGPHEKNDSKECQRQYSGFTTWDELAGINLKSHEQGHSRKALYLQSLNTMTFSNFTFALRVINKRQNQGVNRKTLMTLLASATEHPALLAVKPPYGGAAGAFAGSPSCAYSTAWGGWTLSCLLRCWGRPLEYCKMGENTVECCSRWDCA
ncbi:unnamed protein product [Ectocarpus sp. CCAP 1310/34]|nr:unnamed protein product [Ectocarpus sp. CCAP 1310/34]